MGYGERYGHGTHNGQAGGGHGNVGSGHGGGHGGEHIGEHASGYGLLVAATPPGRHPALDATEALPALAAAPPAMLLGTAAGNVVQLADPSDPNTVLSHLRTAAAHGGPLLLYLSGQLVLDPREHRPHLVLTRSTPRTVRYTGLPWHWLLAEFGHRPLGLTTLIADLVADDELWRQRTRHRLDSGLALYGCLTAPPGRRGTRVPEYSRAVAAVLRGSRVRPSAPELHRLALHQAGFGPGDAERMVLEDVTVAAPLHGAPPAAAMPVSPGAGVTSVPFTPPAPPASPAPHAPHAPHAPQEAPPVPPVPPAPPAAAPVVPAAPTLPAAEAPNAPSVPSVPEPAPTAAPESPPAAGEDASRPSTPASAPAVPDETPDAPPPPPVPQQPGSGEGPLDVPPGVHDAIYAAAGEGRHTEAATLAAQWETAALRSFGPHSREAVHWVEVRADLAHRAGEPARACTLWLQAAALRLQTGQAPESHDVTAAVDRAHHCWHQVTHRAQAYPLGQQLAELRARAPGSREGAVQDVRDRLALLASGRDTPGPDGQAPTG